MLSNLVGESRAYRYAFPARARSLCGLVGEQRAGTRPSRTRAGFAGSADASDRVRVRRVPLRPGDDPRERLEAVDETGSGAHDLGVLTTDVGDAGAAGGWLALE